MSLDGRAPPSIASHPIAGDGGSVRPQADCGAVELAPRHPPKDERKAMARPIAILMRQPSGAARCS
jgi:hypothetical protein